MTFTPTVDRTHDPTGAPTTCWCCARHATGIGVGNPARGDPKYLCPQCVTMIEYIRSIRNFDALERAAIAQTVDAIGPFIERLGSDLGEWEEEDAEAFVRAIVEAFGDELRAVIKDKEVPF